jgi:hypothetical protein
MAGSTGPMLLAGGATFANGWIFNGKGPDFRVLLGTAIAAAGLALLSQMGAAEADLASGIAWIAVVTVIVAPVNGQPSVAENLLKVSGMGK